MRRALFVPVALLVAGCSGEPRRVDIELTLGHETNAFGESPPVTDVVVRVESSSGGVVASAASTPGGTFELGEFPLTELVTITAEGRDGLGQVRMRGRSVGLVPGELASDLLPVFVQRVGSFARPPSELERGHVRGVTAVVGERYLLVTGGSGPDAARATFYDLVSLGPASGGTLPRLAETLVPASNGTALLVIGPKADAPDGVRGATWMDFDSGTLTEVNLPEGLESFDELAGGTAVSGANGTSYVVGATRTTAPTDAVLVVAADRSMSIARLTTTRRGSAVTWLQGPGLVVVGGSAVGAGVETLAPASKAFAPRPFSSDPIEGAAAAPTGNGDEVLLVGGVNGPSAPPTRRLAATCATTCSATELAATGLGSPQTRCRAYGVGPGVTLAVCEDASTGESLVARVADGGATVEAVPLRERRVGASPLPTPLGTLAMLGGAPADSSGAWPTTIELWSPP